MSLRSEIAPAFQAFVERIPTLLRSATQIQYAGSCETLNAEINNPYVKRALNFLDPLGASRSK